MTDLLLILIGPDRYIILSALQNIYSYYIEKDNIYLGKKKSFAPEGRVSSPTAHISDLI